MVSPKASSSLSVVVATGSEGLQLYYGLFMGETIVHTLYVMRGNAYLVDRLLRTPYPR